MSEEREVTAPVQKPYAYHKPGASGLQKITKLRQAFSDLDRLIADTVPAGRERAVAITNLQQTAMWAIKGVVCNDPESVVSE